jgi:hypothetical protein
MAQESPQRATERGRIKRAWRLQSHVISTMSQVRTAERAGRTLVEYPCCAPRHPEVSRASRSEAPGRPAR